MQGIVRRLRSSLGHRWFAPDMAFFHGMRRKPFYVGCTHCGARRVLTGAEIQDRYERAG